MVITKKHQSGGFSFHQETRSDLLNHSFSESLPFCVISCWDKSTTKQIACPIQGKAGDFRFQGLRWVSNPRPSEPQSDALTDWATKSISALLQTRGKGIKVRRREKMFLHKFYTKNLQNCPLQKQVRFKLKLLFNWIGDIKKNTTFAKANLSLTFVFRFYD